MPFKDPYSNNFCECAEGYYPEWFKQYMKKFKKELFKDLRSHISEIVHEEFEKEKKWADGKLFKPLSDKIESSSTTRLLRKKKIFDKDIDLFEKREMKLLKKFDKLYSCKYDRLMYPFLCLEKLESKTSPLFEEKLQLLGRVCQNKGKDAKKTLEPEKKFIKSGKFTLMTENSVFLILKPGAEFLFSVNVLNNGTVSWKSPHMECMSTPDVFIKEQLINLPRMGPGENTYVTIRGKVTQNLGHYCFTYKLFDGSESFGPLFSCLVVVSDLKKKIIPNSEQLKLNNKAIPTGKFICTLIDSENVTIASSQKKIKENIIEIEKTLQDIDLIRPSTSSDRRREERLNDNSEKFQRGCDSIEDKEGKFLKERREEELFCAVDSCEQMGKAEKSGIVENENLQTKKNGTESDSDSELSVILTSEEDENFIFVSLLPESSNSETLNNTTKLSKLDVNKESKDVNQKPKKGIVEERSEKVQPKEVGCKGIRAGENCPCYRSVTEHKGCTEKAKPSFESIPTSCHVKPWNVISNGCYRRNVPPRMFGKTYFHPRYTALNVESNGSPFDYSAEEILSSRNMKTGEKRNRDQGAPDYVFYNTHACCPLKGMKTGNTGNKGHWSNFVPTHDCLGKPIYAVRYDGYCLPIKDLIRNTEVPNVEVVDSKEETQKELKAQTSVNLIANEDATKNTTQNGMISAASKAFETAKCVINNLQFAFKQEVENKPCDTEKLKPHEGPTNTFPYDLYSMGEEERRYVEKLTNKEKYIDAMLALHEMGFVNSDLNFRLLKKHDCQLFDVITEILDTAEKETVGVNTINGTGPRITS